MKTFDAKNLAEAHVDWFLEMVRPLLVANFKHGVKHGMETMVEFILENQE